MSEHFLSLHDLMIEKEPLSLGVFFKISIGLVDIVGRLHQEKTVRKEINPSLIVYDAETHAVQLLAPSVSPVAENATAYLSPEQMDQTNWNPDHRSNLYALGLIFFQMLSGKLPVHLAHPTVELDELSPETPLVLSKIIATLLASNPSERYQSAFGLLTDLKNSQSQWSAIQMVRPFPLSWQLSSELSLPSFPIGREDELSFLLKTVSRIREGVNKVILVRGEAGIGKTTLIQQFLKEAKKHRVSCLTGRYYKGETKEPYLAVRQITQDWVSKILSLPEEVRASIKALFLNALQGNGQVLLNFLPKMEEVLGPQPPLPEISGDYAQYRFFSTFIAFLKEACKVPAIWFIEDLQWADLASLKWFASINTANEIKNLMIVVTLRDDELPPKHPIVPLLSSMAQANRLHQIDLRPLDLPAVKKILGKSLSLETKHVSELGSIILENTGGNPFLINQLLKSLYQQGHLSFSYDQGTWMWDLEVLKGMKALHNVSDLIENRLKTIDEQSLHLLQAASCFQSYFSAQELTRLCDTTSDQVSQILFAMNLKGFVSLEQKSHPTLYRFQHESIRQVLYTSLSRDSCWNVHLQIGRLFLQKGISSAKVIHHFSTGHARLTDPQEKLQLAKLSLTLAERSRQTTAYENAFRYGSFAQKLLPPDSWEHHYSLSFAIHKELSLSSFFNSKHQLSIELDQTLLAHATNELEKSEIYLLQVGKMLAKSEFEKAIVIGLQGLSILGLTIPQNLSPATFHEERRRINQIMQSWTPDDFLQLPTIQDLKARLLMGLQAYLIVPFQMLAREEEAEYVLYQYLQLFFQHGVSPSTAYCLVNYAAKELANNQNVERSQKLAEIALQMMETYNLTEFRGRTLHEYSVKVLPWIAHRNQIYEHLQKAIEAEKQAGDLNFWGFSLIELCRWSPQFNIQESLQWFQTSSQYFKDHLTPNYNVGMFEARWLNLCGKTENRYSLNTEAFDESIFLSSSDELGTVFFHLEKLWIHFIYDDFEGAHQHVHVGKKIIHHRQSHPDHLDFSFLSFLTEAALWPDLAEDEKEKTWQFLKKEHAQMCLWAEWAPENAGHHVLMQKAEFARLSNKNLEAGRLYDQAIQQAQQNQYLPLEAIANELAARFWLGQNRKKVGLWYLYEAFHCFEKWGATEKQAQMMEKYPDLPHFTQVRKGDHLSSGHSLVETSHSLSASLDLQELVPQLLSVAQKNSGADKVVLLVNTPESEEFEKFSLADSSIPMEVFQHVKCTHNRVLRQKPIPLFCLPLQSRGNFLGMLYLENQNLPLGFTPGQLEAVEVIATQSAISLQNALLYQALENKIEETLSTTNELMQETRKSTQMDLELRTTAAIQQQLLPQHLPKVQHFDFACHFRPALETGGDWYSMISEIDGKHFVLIGKVTGRGTSVALITAAAYASCDILKNHALVHDYPLHPSQILDFVNKTIFKTAAPKHQMTFLAASIDLKTGVLTYANAGHHLPILIRDSQHIVLKGDGEPLGKRPDTQFSEESVSLKQGDLLYFYTDGLLKCTNLQGKTWGIHSVVANLKKYHKFSAQELLGRISLELEAFTHGQPLSDETTMICCHALGDF